MPRLNNCNAQFNNLVLSLGNSRKLVVYLSETVICTQAFNGHNRNAEMLVLCLDDGHAYIGHILLNYLMMVNIQIHCK